MRHGQSGTPLYRVWADIVGRCHCPTNKAYKNYGARGISVYGPWRDFAVFAADVGPHPGRGLTFDRENNDGGYEPGNVRWVDRLTQNRNRRPVRLDLTKAETIRRRYAAGGVTQERIGREYGVPQTTISLVVRRKRWNDG